MTQEPVRAVYLIDTHHNKMAVMTDHEPAAHAVYFISAATLRFLGERQPDDAIRLLGSGTVLDGDWRLDGDDALVRLA